MAHFLGTYIKLGTILDKCAIYIIIYIFIANKEAGSINVFAGITK